MWRTNLAIVLTVLGTLAVYTGVANLIPQVQSEVPKELTLGTNVTPEQLVAAGEEVFRGAGGCTACHGLGTRAPNLLGEIGTRCGTRRPGMDCKAYLHESLVDPAAFVVPGFQPIMPDMSRTLSDQQIWAVVAFLESQGGEVTVQASDLAPSAPGAAGAGGASSAGSGGAAAATTTTTTLDPVEIMRANQCLTCHRLGDEGGPIGPHFDGLGSRADADYIRRSILYPNADTAAGYEAVAGTMPQGFGNRLSAAQLEALVQFLEGQK